MKKKVVIFGGAGFIGSNLAFSALDKGYSVAIFDNLSRKGVANNLQAIKAKGGKKVEVWENDINDCAALDELFSTEDHIEGIFHLAAQVAVTVSIVDPRKDFEDNVIGTFNVLEAIRKSKHNPPLVFASTNKVYGDLKHLDVDELEKSYKFSDYPNGIDEQHNLDFCTPYGCSKGAADQYVLDYAKHYGLKTVVMRQSCIYGQFQFGAVDQGWVAWFIIAALQSKALSIYGNGKQVRDILFVDDLVNAYWAAVDKIDTVSGEAFNLGGGKFQMSLLELLERLEDKIGKKIDYSFDTTRPGDQKVFVCDIAKAKEKLAWEPVIDEKQGVDKLYNWIVANMDLLEGY